jgi:hypothetical protein
MKKVLLTLAIVGGISLASCEKDNLNSPNTDTKIQAEKGIQCRGCGGSWDFGGSGDGDGEGGEGSGTNRSGASLRVVADTASVATPRSKR